jgi:hypothetical protein
LAGGIDLVIAEEPDMHESTRSAGERRDPRDRGLDEPLDPNRPDALPDERSTTGTDRDDATRPDDDRANVLTREGPDAPDAADIEDPDTQL